jgi:carboxyl-terminal processing protease
VDPEKLFRSGIDGMLNGLDPYTTYIDEKDQEELKISIQGQYEGVGLPLNFRNNQVTVAEPPFPETPSARAGVREGDRILKVDGVTTEQLGYPGTVQKIRGPAGTEVKLTIEREGESKILEFVLIRERISVDVVRYSGVVDGVGYIRLDHFPRDAGAEMGAAIEKLKAQGAKNLVLDLRSNPGGLLESAIDVASLFLPKGTLIVSDRGRTKESTQEFRSTGEPAFGSGRLAVLVNGYSASASEIVAGAIQDHDRGVIVGDTTFGKGLVQNLVPISQNVSLKITTAKYYTPSGRCIQRQTYSSIDTMDLNAASLYYTENGRTVHGGGGVAPDVLVPLPNVSDLVIDMNRKSLFFNYAVTYSNTHPKVDSNLVITDGMMQDFKQYVKDKKYQYQHPFEKNLAAMKEEAQSHHYGPAFLKGLESVELSMNQVKDAMFDNSAKDIRTILRRELASKCFGAKAEVEIALQDDPVFKKALEILSDNKGYSSALALKK